MKIKITKLLSMLLVVCMMFSFSSVAFAADIGAVGGSDVSSLYEAFQSLKNSEKIGLLDDVYEALKEENLVGTNNAALEAFDKFYTEVKAEETAAKAAGKDIDEEGFEINNFDKAAVKDVYNKTMNDIDNNSADVEVKDLADVVVDVVVKSDAIEPEKKADLVDKVVENLGEGNLGGIGGITIPVLPDRAMVVYDYLNENEYLTADQKVEIMAYFYDLVNGEIEFPDYATATDKKLLIVEDLYIILDKNENLTIEDKVAIALFVYFQFSEEANAVIAAVYAKAYAVAKREGFVDAAVFGLNTAVDALYLAKAYVVNYDLEADADLTKVEAALLEEIDNTITTIDEVVALIENGDDFDTMITAVLALEDDMIAHFETISVLGYELGLVLDPYIIAMNDAVVPYVEMVKGVIDAAYEQLNTIKAFPAAYAAWVEEVGQKVDAINPEIGALVRQYLTANAEDTIAIIYAYGEASYIKLIAEASVAYEDIYGVVAALALVMVEYGDDIYAAVSENVEVQALIAEIQAQLDLATPYYEKFISQPITELVWLRHQDRAAVIATVVANVITLYNELYDTAIAAIDDVNPIAARALNDALTAAGIVFEKTADATGDYLVWLGNHACMMKAEILCALLENTEDFVYGVGAVIDRLILNLIEKVEDEIKDHVSEKFEELKEKLIAYGIDLSKDLEPQIMALLETIAEDYNRCLYNATHTEYCLCSGTHNYVALGGKMTAGESYVSLFKDYLENASEDSFVTANNAAYSNAEVLLTAENLVSYIESKKADIMSANIITYSMDATDTILVLMDAVLGDDVDWSAYLNDEAYAIAERVLAEVYALLAEKYDAETLAMIDPIAEILVYAGVSYGVENIKALETITAYNPDAKVIVVGMANPFAGVTANAMGTYIDLGEVFAYAIEAVDFYNELYAMLTGKVTYVSVADAETVTAAESLNIVVSDELYDMVVNGNIDMGSLNMDKINALLAEVEVLKAQITYLVSGAGAYLTADGQADVYEALAEAVAVHGHTYVFVETVAPTTESIGYDLYVCTCCGAEDFRNKKDKLPPEVIVPDVPYIPATPAEPEHFNCDGGEGCHCNDFEDLDYTMWYHQGVCYMIEHGYMIGIGDNKWAPEQIITRAEIATILWRIAGSEVVDYAMDFSDVEADMWYTEAIRWAVSEEIYLGYGDGTFGPNDEITREQMVTVMYRYELAEGKKAATDFDMSKLFDADEISEWAVEAMNWAFASNLIIGTDVDVPTASPLQNASRAEVAMIFYRKLDNLLK